jgi:hypothetical protein
MNRAAWLGSTMDQGGADKRAWRRLAGVRHVGARDRRCSLVAMEEDEPDEAVAEGYSPKHERRWRGGMMKGKNGGGLSSARGRRKA